MKKFLLSVFFSILLCSYTCLAAETEIKPSYFATNTTNLVFDPDLGCYSPVLSVSPFVPFSRPFYDPNTIFLSGPSDFPFNFADFKIRFGRLSSSDGHSPLSYTKFFNLGSFFFLGSDVYSGCNYSSYLDVTTSPVPFTQFFYPDKPSKSLDLQIPSGHSFSNTITGSLSPLDFNEGHSLGYSDGHSWPFWYGYSSFDNNANSSYFYPNFVALLDSRYTELNFDFPMDMLVIPSGQQYGKNVLTLTGDDYFSFRSLLDDNFSDDVYGQFFGLTLSDGSLDSLLQSVYFSYLPDTFKFVISPDITAKDLLNPDRQYDTPLDPLSTQFLYTAGIYYSLIPQNSHLKTCGPYLFNTGYDISEIDLDSYYKVRLEVYIGDIQVNLSNFLSLSLLDDSDPLRDVFTSNNIPHILESSSSSNTTVFGSNGYFFADILYLENFSFTPTIWFDSSLADINDSLKDLNDSINSGFGSLGDRISDGFYGTIDKLNQIDNSIKDSTKSINKTLDSVASKISSSIEQASDSITHGYDVSAAQALLDEYDRTNSELDNSVGDIFDILKAALDQSDYSVPSWADFSSLFTAFQFVGNYGLTAVYTLLGGAAVIGLVLSFYFALKALWAIIHRGN